MESMVIDNTIAITIDMRNSSNLLDSDDFDFAESVLTEFHSLIMRSAGEPIYSQSTGDGQILIYESSWLMNHYETINSIIKSVSSFINNLRNGKPNLDLGYGIGMHASKLKMIVSEPNDESLVFLIGQCVNTSSKYAYYHNRKTLSHDEFIFEGILTTKTISDFMQKNGLTKPIALKKASGISAYKIQHVSLK